LNNILFFSFGTDPPPIAVESKSPLHGQHFVEFLNIKVELAAFGAGMPPLTSNLGLSMLESVSCSNPYLAGTHAAYHGTVLLLHNIAAAEDPESHRTMVDAALTLARLTTDIGGRREIAGIQANPVLFVSILYCGEFGVKNR
jgi:hypothetical protein